MEERIAFQFGPLTIGMTALASPLFEDVIERHGGDDFGLRSERPDIFRVSLPVGCRVEISDKFRLENPDDAKLIDAGNVLMKRTLLKR